MRTRMLPQQAWWYYLDKCRDSRANRAFFEALKRHVRHGYTVIKWPEVWPEASWLLNDRLHEAVGDAARESETTTAYEREESNPSRSPDDGEEEGGLRRRHGQEQGRQGQGGEGEGVPRRGPAVQGEGQEQGEVS